MIFNKQGNSVTDILFTVPISYSGIKNQWNSYLTSHKIVRIFQPSKNLVVFHNLRQNAFVGQWLSSPKAARSLLWATQKQTGCSERCRLRLPLSPLSLSLPYCLYCWPKEGNNKNCVNSSYTCPDQDFDDLPATP